MSAGAGSCFVCGTAPPFTTSGAGSGAAAADFAVTAGLLADVEGDEDFVTARDSTGTDSVALLSVSAVVVAEEFISAGCVAGCSTGAAAAGFAGAGFGLLGVVLGEAADGAEIVDDAWLAVGFAFPEKWLYAAYPNTATSTTAAIAMKIFVRPRSASGSALAPPNVKDGAGAEVDSAKAGVLSTGAEGVSIAFCKALAGISAGGTSVSRAGAGALAAPLPKLLEGVAAGALAAGAGIVVL